MQVSLVQKENQAKALEEKEQKVYDKAIIQKEAQNKKELEEKLAQKDKEDKEI